MPEQFNHSSRARSLCGAAESSLPQAELPRHSITTVTIERRPDGTLVAHGPDAQELSQSSNLPCGEHVLNAAGRYAVSWGGEEAPPLIETSEGAIDLAEIGQGPVEDEPALLALTCVHGAELWREVIKEAGAYRIGPHGILACLDPFRRAAAMSDPIEAALCACQSEAAELTSLSKDQSVTEVVGPSRPLGMDSETYSYWRTDGQLCYEGGTRPAREPGLRPRPIVRTAEIRDASCALEVEVQTACLLESERRIRVKRVLLAPAAVPEAVADAIMAAVYGAGADRSLPQAMLGLAAARAYVERHYAFRADEVRGCSG